MILKRTRLFIFRFSLGAGDQFTQKLRIFGNQGNGSLSIYNILRLKRLEQSAGNFRVLGDLLEGRANDLRAHGSGFSKFDRGALFGSAGDDIDLVGAILLDGSSDLAEAIYDFFFNLFNHFGVAEMHLANVSRAEAITP